jgi:hypothetical protein
MICGRLPTPAREILALDLQGVQLLSEPGGPICGFDANHVLINVGDYAPSVDWRLSATHALLHCFGYAFMWSVVARMAGGDPQRGSIADGRRGTPGYAWYQSFGDPTNGPNPYHAMTVRIADALALAWGFGEEMGARVDTADLCAPSSADDELIDSELAKVYWGLRRRLR